MQALGFGGSCYRNGLRPKSQSIVGAALIPFLFPILLAVLGAALVSAATIPVLLPWLRQIALAKVTDRSSHKVPTPQGGGLGVLTGLLVALLALWMMGLPVLPWTGVAALIGIAALGFIDDVHALPASRRIVAQALFLLIPFLSMAQVPPGLVALSPVFGTSVLRVIIVILGFVGLLWIVNLTNFMDGLDGIIVASYGPGLLAAGYLLLIGHGEPFGFVALATGGALFGFAFWNWTPAKIFLGDAGSLLVGLVTALAFWLLLLNHEWAAAVLLWLYPFLDATLTLARRLFKGEQVWQAHRQHAYQRGVDQGLSVKMVSGAAGVYALVAGGASLAVAGQGAFVGALAVACVSFVCVVMMVIFHRGQRTKA